MSEFVRHHAHDAVFRLLVQAVRDYAVFMLDPEGRVATWNVGAQRLKQYTATEIVGQHFSVFYPEEDKLNGKPARALESALADGSYEDEGWRLRQDGSRFWANVAITPLFDLTGQLQGFAEVTRDLTDQRAAEEEVRQGGMRLQLLIDSIEDYAIFMLDPEGRIATWNSGAQRLKQYSASEIIGRHFSAFYPAADRAAGKPEQALATAALVGRCEDEGMRVRKDGSQFFASVVISAIRDGDRKLVGFAKVTRDLTDKRRAEAERLELARAAEAVRLRDEFLSIASHELNTPLTTLHLQLQSVARDLDKFDEPTRRRILRAKRSGERLGTLVDMLLDVSRVAAGKLTLQLAEVDLAASAREAVDRLSEEAAIARCPLTVQAAAPVVGRWDRARLEQVVSNLVGNAFRYAAGTPVEVTVELHQGSARLVVRDGGPGIPAEALGRIFDRFERASPAENYGGLGLGLYITRQIVDAHGGTVRAASAPGGGAAFTVLLPLVPPAAGAEGGRQSR